MSLFFFTAFIILNLKGHWILAWIFMINMKGDFNLHKNWWMAKISKLESRKTVIHIRFQCSNEKPGSSISVYQGKASKILKQWQITNKMYFFLGHFCTEFPHATLGNMWHNMWKPKNTIVNIKKDYLDASSFSLNQGLRTME